MINGIPANLKRIKATSEKIIKIYYEYKDNIDYDKDYFKEFNNIIKKEDLFHNYNYEIDNMLFEKY